MTSIGQVRRAHFSTGALLVRKESRRVLIQLQCNLKALTTNIPACDFQGRFASFELQSLSRFGIRCATLHFVLSAGLYGKLRSRGCNADFQSLCRQRASGRCAEISVMTIAKSFLKNIDGIFHIPTRLQNLSPTWNQAGQRLCIVIPTPHWWRLFRSFLI